MSKMINLAQQYKYLITIGFKVTILISIAAIFLGLVLGIILAIMKTSKFKALKAFASTYVVIMRGTPIMIQLCMVYYGTALIGINFPSVAMFGGKVTSDRLIAAVIGLGLNAGALICEIVRSGIQSIDKGQAEASLSLGLNGFQTMTKIVLPQSIINILPALGNEFVNMIKNSSSVTIIGLSDLMYVSNLIRGQSYQPFTPFLIVGIIYLILTVALSNIVKVYEKRINRSRK